MTDGGGQEGFSRQRFKSLSSNFLHNMTMSFLKVESQINRSHKIPKEKLWMAAEPVINRQSSSSSRSLGERELVKHT